MIAVLGQALWFILPALAPSSGAVLVGGGAPVDFGKKAKDGRRLLGPGKTWRGLAGGTAAGLIMGVIFNFIALEVVGKEEWAFSEDWATSLLIIFLLAFGSMMGDLGGSFLKRRLGKEKGAKFPVLDQYDLFLGAILLVALFQYGWLEAHYLEGDHLYGLIFIIVLIPLLHRLTNIMGYKMGKKEVPW